ncbi:MAG: DNA primase [Pelotomaculum sp. PtaB.Bin013]|uniref:CHC2 zinc finger domain-containing protein n=1 Tax=Pelotomaculum isophthalicicum JI TaxID=947010 RepID=A0A9X4H587_9FIRM|nr:CHC2 zinc finger domain-containing protein [Pelotomaculum isophthalicicum]MDF9408267.1 CHC2 zinc finger domain-containing protein [Pelotomaculum isophthalicicum JI]OPX91613.1 MAG: DNA primase [Pelotomaculum sp. PtaB.Bin013]
MIKLSVPILQQNNDIFQLVKELPFIEVARRYLPGELRHQGSRWVTRCPFHEDRYPSLVVYRDGWKCFGCQEHGDSVDLVALLHNLRPLEAARMIAADFGIPLPDATQEDIAQARQATLLAKARRELKACFKVKENEVYQRLSSIYRAVDSKLAGIQTEEDLERLGGLYHIEPILEHVLEVLRTGKMTDKVAVLKSDRVKRWCNK